jgi:hypothetical protein
MMPAICENQSATNLKKWQLFFQRGMAIFRGFIFYLRQSESFAIKKSDGLSKAYFSCACILRLTARGLFAEYKTVLVASVAQR